VSLRVAAARINFVSTMNTASPLRRRKYGLALVALLLGALACSAPRSGESVAGGPSVDEETMASLLAEGRELASRALRVTAAGITKDLPPSLVRSALRVSEGPDGLELVLGRRRTMRGLRSLFPAQTAPVDASFVVRDGGAAVVPGRPGTKCCGSTAPEVVLEALRDGVHTVRLPLVRTRPGFTTADARALGIEAEVGRPDEFGPTTWHVCCEDRVSNIHRIADIVRGHVVMPGETLSVNALVGPRTVEKGFVPAGVIYDGVFTTDVGGGVSQFATTLFNAAFFAGLDFEEYQSHSIYIDRYPYGREATISYPSPDLAIRNTTPYGVLIWPTYTETSLTVHLYSTPYVDVRAGEVEIRDEGNCARVLTPRIRTYRDGRVVEDFVGALYRAAEGASC
jgi:hypothetical protein